jgi:hypothetical protein
MHDLQVCWFPIDRLVAYEKNARTHVFSMS